MVKFGIIADTHITKEESPLKVKKLIDELQKAFNDVDEIIHAGDVTEDFFLSELKKIAPVRCVKGIFDNIEQLPNFIKIQAGKYNIGVIHKLPEDLESFFKKNELHILIYGQTHQPLIQGTAYNTLYINPGSPTEPKAPPQKRGFEKPVARPSVMTLKIDNNDLLSTFLINLKI